MTLSIGEHPHAEKEKNTECLAFVQFFDSNDIFQQSQTFEMNLQSNFYLILTDNKNDCTHYHAKPVDLPDVGMCWGEDVWYPWVYCKVVPSVMHYRFFLHT